MIPRAQTSEGEHASPDSRVWSSDGSICKASRSTKPACRDGPTDGPIRPSTVISVNCNNLDNTFVLNVRSTFDHDREPAMGTESGISEQNMRPPV